jgi:hypothetical protein
MRHSNNQFLATLDAATVAGLTNIVKETIAMDPKPLVQKKFSAADLWSIQKQRRVFVQRRA